jgi:uncharacterized protein (TIGR03437 family)
LAVLTLSACAQLAGQRRILYVTATYGFRHGDAIEASKEVFQEIARQSGGALAIDHTENVALLTADNLRNYDAVYFYTSGELPLSDRQKADLLAFVRSGKGFGGSHSATDCLYTWPEYGDMIGGYFDGHPWTQEAAVNVEDPQSPLSPTTAPGFRFFEEFYQFRAFSRDRVRVLLTLDSRSVDMAAPGINRKDGDFALAWIRPYGNGRVFYSAFGHFPDSFRLQPVRTMLGKALLWLAGLIEADATPRSSPSATPPAFAADGVRDLAGTNAAFAPGEIISISGERLTSGPSAEASGVPLPVSLAGTQVTVNGVPVPLFSARPDRLLVQLPAGLTPGEPASIAVSTGTLASRGVPLRIEVAAPKIIAASRAAGALVLYLSGLGATVPPVAEGMTAPPSLARTVVQPAILINGERAAVFYSGLAPGFVGVYQVNVLISSDAPASFEVVAEAAGQRSNVFQVRPTL